MTRGAGFPFRRRGGLAAGCVALLSACGWASLDVLVPAPLVSVSGDDGSPGASDSPSMAEPDGAGGEEIPTAPPTADCTSSAAAVDQWTFDTSVQGWTLSLDPDVQASVAWASSMGEPSPGAIQVDVTPAVSDAGTINGAWLQLDAALGDLSGLTASAWVWLDRGATPHLKLYLQTGSQYGWADNGTVYLPLQTWICVSLPISSPAYQQASYDPTDTVRVGFEMLGTAPFRLYVDSVRIR
jgi:hypothetical protein